MGRHVFDLTPNMIVMALKYCWVAQPFQLLAIGFGKLAAVTYLAGLHGVSLTDRPLGRQLYTCCLLLLQEAALYNLCWHMYLARMMHMFSHNHTADPANPYSQNTLDFNSPFSGSSACLNSSSQSSSSVSFTASAILLPSSGILRCREHATGASGTSIWLSSTAVSSQNTPKTRPVCILGFAPIDNRDTTGFSAFSNLCIALYPSLIFWNLQIKATKKVVLCLLFGSGIMYVFLHLQGVEDGMEWNGIRIWVLRLMDRTQSQYLRHHENDQSWQSGQD